MVIQADQLPGAPPPTGASGWKRWFPGLLIFQKYQASWLPREIIAGLVLASMLVPVGMAYAVASGVPGIYGLYATIVPLLAYAIFNQAAAWQPRNRRNGDQNSPRF